MPLTVATIVGTRPEIIKLSCVIAALDRATRHVLIHTGQNFDYELNQIFFDGLGIRPPDHFLDAAGTNAVDTIASVLRRIDPVLAKESPDAVLILGDTNSCLGVLAAKRRKIPVFHMEAGNRSFDERVPEEINRRIIDHISDINMPYSEHARRYLLDEGIRPETIIKTGSPMKQVLHVQRDSIAASSALQKQGVSAGSYFIVSAHREENVDDPVRFDRLLAALRRIAERYRMPVVVSTHPRTRKRLESHGAGAMPDAVRFLKPLAFADYISLQSQSKCVLSDSGTITEEASILGFPAVMLREAHERPEGMDEGTLIMCGTNPDLILDAIETTLARRVKGGGRPHIVADYDVDDVASKVVNTIYSYTDYVNRVIWRKP